MTFEEFLIRKKIDAFQFKANEQSIYSEFESHFKLMGEKSFDHSKKFWFNKLRRAYHLKEVPKPVNTDAPTDQFPTLIKEQAGIEVLNLEKPAYVPRFKAAATQTPDLPAQSVPSSGYVPRFKAAIKTPEKVGDSMNSEAESEEIAKTVFKPKFKGQIATQDEAKPEISSDPIPPSTESVKSAYKPRFNPGLTKKNPETE